MGISVKLISHQGYIRTHRLAAWLQIRSAAVLLLLIAELPRSTSKEFDYCAIESELCERGTHTMCLYQEDGPGPACSGYFDDTLNEDDKKAIVDKHNELRNNIALGNVPSFPKSSNMMELSWDEDLAKIAQRWADQCTYDHDVCRDLPHRFHGDFHWNVGQNVAYGWRSPPFLCEDPETQIQYWYNEISKYSYEAGPYKGLIAGHFTQIVWGFTYLIGCGRSGWRRIKKRLFKKDKITFYRLLVCNYAPAGNIKTYHLYREGEPCSLCSCSALYPGLCAVGSKIINNQI